MSVRRCQREVTSAEFAEWIAFYRLEDEAADPYRLPDADQLAAKVARFGAMAGTPGDLTQTRR